MMNRFTPTAGIATDRVSHTTAHSASVVARTLAIAAVALALVTAGCSSSAATPPATTLPATTAATTTEAPTTTVAPTTAKPLWANTELTPFSAITEVNGIAVVYATDESKTLFVEAISADGKTLWKQPASRSNTRWGVEVQAPLVSNGHVVYLRPATTGELMKAQLVAADPATGADVATSEPAVFGSWPFECGAGDACAQRDSADQTSRTLVALDQKTGALTDRGPKQLADAQLLWGGKAGLFTSSSRGNPDEFFEFISGGKAAWKVPVSSIFPAGYTSKNGWQFDFDSTASAMIGGVFGPVDMPDQNTYVQHGESLTVALSVTDGHLLWKTDAQPCAGGFNVLGLCHISGTRTTTASGDEKLDGVSSTLMALDPISGKQRWTIDLGKVWGGPGFSYGQTRSHDAGEVIKAESGPMVVDLATGTHRSPNSGETFVCSSGVYYDFSTDLPPATGYGQGGFVDTFCSADGTEIAGDSVPSDLVKLGTTVGKVMMFATPKGVVAFSA